MWTTLRQDVTHAFRLYRRTPAATLIALATMALGVGANTAIFSLADALLLRPLPVADPERLVALQHVDRDVPANLSSFSHPDYVDIRDRLDGPVALAAWSSIRVTLTGPAREAVPAHIVSANYFDVVGVDMTLGRGFRADDAPRVTILSDALWRRRFAAATDVIGRSLEIHGQPFTIVGVAPRRFRGLDLASSPLLWVPLDAHRDAMPSFRAFGTDLFDNRGTHWLELTGRLRDDASAGALADRLRVIADEQSRRHPETNRSWSIALTSAADARLGPPSNRPAVRITTALLAAVGLVLALACANVANLLLAGAAARRREMGIRLAVGASRRRLWRQVITETVVLGLAGGTIGLAVAALGVRVFALHEAAAWLPALDVAINTRVLLFALAVSVATGVVFGLAPAAQVSATRVVPALRGETPTPRGRRWRLPMRHALLTVQVAIGLVLLVGAGLALRTVWNLQSVPLGFDPARIAVIRVDAGAQGLTEDRGRAFFAEFASRLRTRPEVEAAGVAYAAPFDDRRAANDIFWEPTGASGERRRRNVDLNFVGEGYFDAMGLRLLRGRGFAAADARRQPGAAVINLALAEALWPGEDPIGRSLWSWNPDGAHAPLEVVGVVGDGRYYRSWRTAGRPFLFLAFPDWYQPEMAVHVRLRPGRQLREGDAQAVAAAVDGAITAVDVQSAASTMAAAIAVERASAQLVAALGALALGIAVIGVYGVVSFLVAARRREIGVRLALGAGRARVQRDVLRDIAAPLIAGIVLGAAAAAVATGLARRLLYGVSPYDPVTFVVVALLLLVTAFAAGLLPARRAARVDPLTVLKQE